MRSPPLLSANTPGAVASMSGSRDSIAVVVVLLMSAALGVGGVVALRWTKASDERTEARPMETSGVAVSVASVTATKRSLEIDSRGFLVPFEELTLSAEVSGTVEEQLVDVPDRVHKGDTLFQLDDSLRDVAINKALADAKGAASDVHKAEENARRVERLKETDSARPVESLDAETALAKANAVAQRAQAAVAEARLLKNKSTLIAPRNGVIARIYARQGEYAHAGQPLVDIIVLDRLKLTVQVDDREIVELVPGDTVAMVATALPGRTLSGSILRIFPRAVPDSRKFEVEILVPNPDRRLRPGFFVEAKIKPTPLHAADQPTILTLPRLAISELYRQQYCFVVRKDINGGVERAHWTPIETLPILTDPQHVQVVSGLHLADRVVITGLQHVTDDCAVRIVE